MNSCGVKQICRRVSLKSRLGIVNAIIIKLLCKIMIQHNIIFIAYLAWRVKSSLYLIFDGSINNLLAYILIFHAYEGNGLFEIMGVHPCGGRNMHFLCNIIINANQFSDFIPQNPYFTL